MSCKHKFSAALAAIASLASSALFAQAPPTLVIAFNGSVEAVPLDAWTSVGAALAIAAAAYAFFRHRRAGSLGRVSAWLVVVAIAAGATLVASRVDLIAAANAVANPILTLTTSPASIVIGGVSTVVEVDNGINAPIRIDSIGIQNPAPGQQIVPFPGANCVAGLTLPVRGSCFVAVNVSAPG